MSTSRRKLSRLWARAASRKAWCWFLPCGLIEDLDQWLEKLAPFRKDYKHHQTGEDNGDSHLKALLIHHEVIVPVTAGKLDLGTWQRIFYAEFDGQRDKRVIVKVMGE
jgi:secondary thiamine-phosphate synthase enzyme